VKILLRLPVKYEGQGATRRTRTQIQGRLVKAKKLALLLLLVFLSGCYSGSVKPLLNRPEFKVENEPIRTLRILLVADDSYRESEIKKFVLKCSRLVEMQVGIRLEILDWYQIKWEDELDDIIKMEIRIATDTWRKRDQFDIVLTFVNFVHSIKGGKLPLGATDTFFWRYLFVKELDPYILLHELFHAFLLEQGHSESWVMRGARPPYGSEWYWLTPEDRKKVLRNKWRDFDVMPATEQEEEKKSKESWFYYRMGSAYLEKREFEQGVLLLNKSIEINPRHAEAYFNRGRGYYFIGKYDRSWEDIKKAQDLGYKIPAEFFNDLSRVSERNN
jgi:tetratricopeptide (TPR) repeat protein